MRSTYRSTVFFLVILDIFPNTAPFLAPDLETRHRIFSECESPKPLVWSALPSTVYRGESRLRHRPFNLLDFRPCENQSLGSPSVLFTPSEICPHFAVFSVFRVLSLPRAVLCRFGAENRTDSVRFWFLYSLPWVFALPLRLFRKFALTASGFCTARAFASL